jgi:hypothetical protein
MAYRRQRRRGSANRAGERMVAGGEACVCGVVVLGWLHFCFLGKNREGAAAAAAAATATEPEQDETALKQTLGSRPPARPALARRRG